MSRRAEFETLISYGLGRCLRCVRIMHAKHLDLVDTDTWCCSDRSDCEEFRWLKSFRGDQERCPVPEGIRKGEASE